MINLEKIRELRKNRGLTQEQFDAHPFVKDKTKWGLNLIKVLNIFMFKGGHWPPYLLL